MTSLSILPSRGQTLPICCCCFCLVSVISRFFSERYIWKEAANLISEVFFGILSLSNQLWQKPLTTFVHTVTLYGNRILTSFLSLAYLTTVGSSVILIPSPLDTDAICWQNFLRWPSLHQRKGAKQAKAQVWMRAPSWSDLFRMSHAPSRGTSGWSCGLRLSLGAGRTRPSTLTMSVLTEVLNSSFKYLLLALIISWA